MAFLPGTEFADFLNGTGDADVINGWPSNAPVGDFGSDTDNDSLNGFEGDDSISGGGGDDLLTSGVGDDSLFGGSGNDVLYVGLGGLADEIDGGSGTDFVQLDREGTTLGLSFSIADPLTQQTLADGTILRGIEQIIFYAGGGDDAVTGGISMTAFSEMAASTLFLGATVKIFFTAAPTMIPSWAGWPMIF